LIIETFIGLIIVLASGLVGTQVLIDEQPSLKITLHHLNAYRDVIGLCALIGGLLGMYHSFSTGFSTLYSPIYWLSWTSSNIIALCVGIYLASTLLVIKIPPRYPSLIKLCAYIRNFVDERSHAFCWLGLALGSWRVLYPWLST
jgi:hypothetical protein